MVESAWARLRAHLVTSRSAIQDEIRNYPTPITACDEQFNYLLEKRDHLIDELNRIDEAITNGNTRLAIDIVQQSESIGEGIKTDLIDELDREPNRFGR